MTKITYIPGEIANAAIDEHGNRKPVTRTQHIFDDAKGKSQAEVNADIDDTFALHQSEINALDSQNYVTVDSFNALPATGSADTVYRVSNWDGTQQDPSVYSEYAWNGSQYVHLSTKTQIGEVFDISAYHATGGTLATYADLTAALGTNGANIPDALRKGGMSVKYVQSYDNKYVQYRYMSSSTAVADFTNVDNWQGVDSKPTAGSRNFVESGVVELEIFNTELQNAKDAFRANYNLFNGHHYKGYFGNGGINFIPDNAYYTSGFISVEEGQTYKRHNGGGDYYIYAYDSEHKPFNIDTDRNRPFIESSTITIPVGVAYIRFIFLASKLNNVIFYKGTHNINNSDIVSNYPQIQFVNLENVCAPLGNTIKNILNLVKTDISFDKAGYIRVPGYFSSYRAVSNTGIFYIRGIKYIEYVGRIDNSGYSIAFFDKNGNILPSISVVGNGSVQSGTVDLSDSSYAEAYYCCVSNYQNPNAYVKVYSDSSLDLKLMKSAIDTINETYPETIKQIKGLVTEDLTVSISESGYVKANGTMGTGGYNTGFINIAGFTSLEGTSKFLDSSALVVAFYDVEKQLLPEISIAGTAAATFNFSVNLKDSAYIDAVYVIVSSWNEMTNGVTLYNSDKIKQPFLTEKKFCALGDSITDGDGNHSYSWYDYLLKRYNAVDNSLNFAVSGSCLRAMADFCTAENMADIDICFVMGGTNQLVNFRMGTINDDATPDKWEKNKEYSVGDRVTGGTRQTSGTTNWSYLYWYECIEAGTSGNTDFADGFPTTTDETFTDGTVTWKCIGNPSWYSDMKRICTKVWGYNPKIQIIWMIPIRTKSDVGKTPEQYTHVNKYNAIRTFCEYNSIRMIDLQKEFPLNEYTQNAIMADNLHPNDKGYKIIQDIVCSHIE